MQQATDLARQMVTRWGMSDRLGPVKLAPRDDPVPSAARPRYGGARPFGERHRPRRSTARCSSIIDRESRPGQGSS